MNTFQKFLLSIALSLSCGNFLKAEPYKGTFTPDVDTVLSGQFAKNFPPLPEVDFGYNTKGFDTSRLPKVPEVGVHPRVIITPKEVEIMRKKVAQGAQADRVFKIVLQGLKNKAASKARPFYNDAPWANVSVIAAKALLAMITEDHQLGQEAAKETVEHARYIESIIDIFNAHPEAVDIRHNFYYFTRTGIRLNGRDFNDVYREGGPDLVRELAQQKISFYTKDHQFAFTSLGTEYDYAYNFMTKEQRDLVRRTIAKCTHNKYTSGHEIPGHFFINNHMSMGAWFFTFALSIEGEEGYDPRVVDTFIPRLEDKLTYDISPKGILYENVKGFIPVQPILAAAMRGPKNLLRHDHVYERINTTFHSLHNTFNRYTKRARNRPKWKMPEIGEGLKEERFWSNVEANSWSWFYWTFIMKHFYPNDVKVDTVYHHTLNQSSFDLFDGSPDETHYGGKIHYNMLSMLDVMLMCATDEKLADYTQEGLPSSVTQNLPYSHTDLVRGIVETRAGWGPDDIYIHYECRSDMFYGGHETPEHGDFRFVANGVNWSPYTGAYMDSYFRNMVLIDGLAGVYQPTPGKLLSVSDNDAATIIASDATDAYEWKKHEKNFYHWHGMLDQIPAHTAWQKNRGFRINRDWELPFQPHMKKFYDGFAHLDWGPWHGETRGPEYYERWNDVDHVFRTMALTRGEHPYLLIVDDVRKDNNPHQYDWNFNLPGDVELYKATSFVKNRRLEKGTQGDIGTDLIFTVSDSKRSRKPFGIFGGWVPNQELEPKKGDPMLLVRVLWRNTEFPYPLPSYEKTWAFSRVKVPAFAVDPEFRVMLYPYRFGDPLPVTEWSDDRKQLSVQIGEQKDLYFFDQTDRGRTTIALEKNGQIVASSNERPAKPELAIKEKWTIDRNLPDDQIRSHQFDREFEVVFQPPASGTEIRYTTNGSSPTTQSPLYEGPFIINESVHLKAITVHDAWKQGPQNLSHPFELKLKKTPLLKAITTSPDILQAGLQLKVYEVFHTIFSDDGFFRGSKNMIPILTNTDLSYTLLVENFEVPKLAAKKTAQEMAKGYFSYEGYFKANQPGTYRFCIDSTGPIRMSFNDHVAYEVIGTYGLSQKKRYAEVSLEAGLHKMQLIICDPIFWQGAMTEPLPLSVTVMSPGHTSYKKVASSTFMRPFLKTVAENKTAETLSLKASKINKGSLKAGLRRERFNWTAALKRDALNSIGYGGDDVKVPTNGVSSNFFTQLDHAPYAIDQVFSLKTNPQLKKLTKYHGYFKARITGLYEFQLDPKGVNQLRLNGKVVAQNRVEGQKPTGHVQLEAGFYPLEIALSKSSSHFQMKPPRQQNFIPITAGDFFTESTIQPKAEFLIASLDFETSNLKSLKQALKGQKQIELELQKVSLQKGRKGGKALQIDSLDSFFKMTGVSTLDNELSISMWFKRTEADSSFLIEAQPNRFEARLRNNQLGSRYYRSFDYARTIDEISPKKSEWVHYSFYFGKQLKIYINGELKSSTIVDPTGAQYGNSVSANAHTFEFLKGEVNGLVDDIIIYGKELSIKKIKELAQ